MFPETNLHPKDLEFLTKFTERTSFTAYKTCSGELRGPLTRSFFARSQLREDTPSRRNEVDLQRLPHARGIREPQRWKRTEPAQTAEAELHD